MSFIMLWIRAALPERPTYPAFAPDQFPIVQFEAHEALRLAKIAIAEDPGSTWAARDLAYAQATVARWPDGSAISPGRDAAEVAYSHALKAYGRSFSDFAL